MSVSHRERDNASLKCTFATKYPRTRNLSDLLDYCCRECDGGAVGERGVGGERRAGRRGGGGSSSDVTATNVLFVGNLLGLTANSTDKSSPLRLNARNGLKFCVTSLSRPFTSKIACLRVRTCSLKKKEKRNVSLETTSCPRKISPSALVRNIASDCTRCESEVRCSWS